jgi:hypothetical protein
MRNQLGVAANSPLQVPGGGEQQQMAVPQWHDKCSAADIVGALIEVRDANSSGGKSSKVGDEELYCHCHQPDDGSFMVCCELPTDAPLQPPALLSLQLQLEQASAEGARNGGATSAGGTDSSDGLSNGTLLSLAAAEDAANAAEAKAKARAKEKARRKKKQGPKLKTITGKMGPTQEQRWWYGARNNETPRAIATKMKVRHRA